MGTKGSCSSEHVILVASDGQEDVIECVGVGAIRRSFVSARPHVVYRYKGEAKELIRKRVVEVAEWLSGNYSLENRTRLNRGMNDAQVNYASTVKTAGSVFRAKFRGLSSHRRIARIAEQFAANQQPRYKMICSEFAATCYEVAAWDCHALSPLGIDPRAMTAKALEAVLNRSEFKLVGSYEGQVSHKMHMTMVGKHFIGQLLVVGDRELAMRNSIATVGSTPLTVPGSIPGAASTDETCAVVEFTKSFSPATLNARLPGTKHARIGAYDYVYSNASPGLQRQHTMMALRAPV